MRGLRAVTLLVVAALLSTACGASQAGTAAYVGDTTVSVRSLQSQVDLVLAYRSGATEVRSQLPAVTARVLSQDVLRGLVQAAVTRTGLPVDEKAIADQLAALNPATVLAQPAQNYLTPDSFAALVRDQLILAQLGKRSWDGLGVTVDLVTATDRGDAQNKARRMAVSDAESAAVVAEANANTQQAQQGLALSPATAATLAATPVFATPAGDAVAFALAGQQSQAPQWYVARILSRRTDAAVSTASGAVPAAQATISNTLSLGLSLLPQLAGDPQVRLNPRYGQWDPTASRVIAATDVPSAIVVTSAG